MSILSDFINNFKNDKNRKLPIIDKQIYRKSDTAILNIKNIEINYALLQALLKRLKFDTIIFLIDSVEKESMLFKDIHNENIKYYCLNEKNRSVEIALELKKISYFS